MLLYEPEIERAGGWDTGIKFAERLRAPVYMTPLSDKASFPQTHPQFRGMAPFAIGPLSKKLRGHDLIIVVGAQVFRYYPYVAGDYLPKAQNSCKSQVIPTMRPPLSSETACWQTQS